MLLDTIFAPFVKERPICVMARAVLERLLDAQRLDDLFARTAQRQYTRELLFSSLVQLMSEVVLGVHPTVHAAYQANKDAIGVSTTALYNKLDRVETGGVRGPRARLRGPRRAGGQGAWSQASALGAGLSDQGARWQSSLCDRAPPQRLARHLGRPVAGASAGGLGSAAHVDHRCDAERGWPCPGAQHDSAGAPTRRGGSTVDRGSQLLHLGLAVWHGPARGGVRGTPARQLQGELLGRAQRTGTTRSGPVYEQAMQVRDPASGETMRMRRLTIQLKVPTRDGDTELHILSNVPSGRASAAHLARVYGKRWSIETAFFEITTTLACEINTLGYPKAALFTFCLALLAYNAVSLIKAALRSAPWPPEGQ